MNFMHAPTRAVAPGAPRVPTPRIDPATAARFRFLEEHGAQARLDNLRTDPMTPTLALEHVAASLHEDAYRQVVITPRRGPVFALPMWRSRGVVTVAP